MEDRIELFELTVVYAADGELNKMHTELLHDVALADKEFASAVAEMREHKLFGFVTLRYMRKHNGFVIPEMARKHTEIKRAEVS